MSLLDTGDAFPPVEGESVAHGHVRLPADVPAGRHAVVLVYRAHW